MRRVALAALVIAVVIAGVRWGTFVAGGSDSYCYLYQAERWASGRLQVPEPLALEAPWPDAPLTFAPAGHRPSPTVSGANVPICPSGLSVAMAPFVALGGIRAAFFVIPLFGALLIGSTYVAGSRFGPRIGMASALVAACNPIFLFQLMQPMSDVAAAALWMLAVAAVTGTRPRAAIACGAAAAAAILMRPNLFPLAIPLAAFLYWRPERSRQTRTRAFLAFSACVCAGCLAVALIQRAFYGSVFSSGYGSLEALFGADHIVPNSSRYLTWLSNTLTPAWIVAATAPFLLPGPLTLLSAALIVTNAACYLPYVVFDDWSYIRFVLPTIPLLVILTIAAIDAACRRIAPRFARTVVIGTAVVLAALGVREARARNVFGLEGLEARYERAGDYVARRLPENALIITSWQSGSVRFYSGRLTLVWDVLDPRWLDRAVEYLRGRGLEPYLLFESWEEPLFRQRFPSSTLGALDWPPAAESPRVRIYRPADRERYLSRGHADTDYFR